MRSLLKSPGFAVAAVATLALGIGANTAIFSLVTAVVLRPFPYGDPARIVVIWNLGNRDDVTHLSVREILSYGEEAPSLTHLAGYTETNVNLTGGTEPERVPAAAVTANIFDTLGVGAALGRGFAATDNDPGAAAVVVLGHGLWQRRFGGSPDIIGRTIPVNGRPRTVIGVMPASFQLPMDYRSHRPTEIWIPIVIDRANLGQWGSRSYFGIGRLRADATARQATSELHVVTDRWIRAGHVKPSADSDFDRSAVPIQEFIVGNVRRPLFILFAAVGLVLLIACANVVNLLLARADARRREIAIRAALGASRGDILRQLLTETFLLAALGGIAAMAVARGALHVLIAARPDGVPRIEETSVDPIALAFTTALSVGTAILCGLVPAIQLSRQQLATVLNEAGRGAAYARTRAAVRRGLVVAQLAFSVVLVVGAGLLLRTLVALDRIDLGFNPERVLTAQLQLPVSDYPSDRVAGFYRELIDRIENVAGVEAAGAARVLPIARTIGDWSISIEGRPLVSPNENPNGDFQAVTPGYFKAMGLTLLQGRFLSRDDREDAPLVVVINDTMANRYWPGQDPLGRRFTMGGAGTTLPALTIVGVVRTSRHNTIIEEPRAEMYFPHAQLGRAVGGPVRAMAIVVKTATDPLSFADILRGIVRSMDRNLPIADVRSMDRIMATAMSGPRFAALLLGLFAVLAMVLAAIGTYATISLLVSERSHEIGIRMALGAHRRAILTWILTEGLLVAGSGIAIGTVVAVAATRVMKALLYGVTPLDPLTFGSVAVLLVVVAASASLIPARRAASIDPATTLRQG